MSMKEEEEDQQLLMKRKRLTAEVDFDSATAASVVAKIRRRLPDFLNSVKLKYVKLGILSGNGAGGGLFVAVALVAALISAAVSGLLRKDGAEAAAAIAAFALLTAYLCKRPRPVYLLEFACYKPEDHQGLKITREEFLNMSEVTGVFTGESLGFQAKIVARSGLGDETYLPEGVQATPPRLNMEEARREAAEVMFGCLDALFGRTGIDPRRDVGILVVNCSLFNPTPSLSAMIVNRYRMREDIKSFNLGGMGCSAGVIAVDLAKHLLQANPNSLAVVLSMENTTLNWYYGNDRSMLLPNCIFRMGGGAVLLSNRAADRRGAKYKLLHTVRTHKGGDGRSYGCVYQREDDGGRVGVSLARELMEVAGEALKTNITTLGPLVLPMSEQLRFLWSLAARRTMGRRKGVKPYIPDFRKAFEHFCIHAGGRAVLDEMQKNLSLGEVAMEASRSTLHRFGNTSSSSLWYELAYEEAKGRVKRGNRVWQIGFGSGFKCNSAVWLALRDVPAADVDGAAGDRCNPWADCVHRYPVPGPATAK